ncbi:MAG: hypothetical protein NWT08_13025 [Akkermansiaceae bacterium]|jgi:hypothetical protein|nr:hypothetical protein [Akkermansiaceae bacterium]MDP4647727.1 hypothetical protein [Akkermansiaceae bacterium]MDP4722212.1 hypothetical protein [Akkermansiaceae bacterium]MDP4780253.1 hypothetical protein [Akkermansiaceae bacterium]MDP4848622.1 hypothetical protein [Akkermansiaceae bacterium]
MKNYLIIAVACVLTSCGGAPEALVVKSYTLRDQDATIMSDPMVQNEKMRRLHGAVSVEERKQRLGEYYTVQWNAEAGLEKEIIFQYQQGKSGSRIKRMTQTIPAGTSEGKQEFAVIGDDYFDNGRVLTWKMTLKAGGEVISTKQSYLWE